MYLMLFRQCAIKLNKTWLTKTGSRLVKLLGISTFSTLFRTHFFGWNICTQHLNEWTVAKLTEKKGKDEARSSSKQTKKWLGSRQWFFFSLKLLLTRNKKKFLLFIYFSVILTSNFDTFFRAYFPEKNSYTYHSKTIFGLSQNIFALCMLRKEMSKRRYRLVVLGSGKVGKTAIIRRYLHGAFDDKYRETIEDLYSRDFNIQVCCWFMQTKFFSCFSKQHLFFLPLLY